MMNSEIFSCESVGRLAFVSGKRNASRETFGWCTELWNRLTRVRLVLSQNKNSASGR